MICLALAPPHRSVFKAYRCDAEAMEGVERRARVISLTVGRNLREGRRDMRCEETLEEQLTD